MKKFASLTLAVLIVLSMALIGVVSASAAGINFNETGSIEMLKTDPKTGDVVEGATFTAYRVLTLENDGDSDGTYTVVSAFGNVISADTLTGSGKANSNGGLYTNTDELQALIPDLEAIADTLATNGDTVKAFNDNGDGKYSIDGLKLGVYLVIENEPPKNYIKSTASFLVTVPQWTGSEWDYTIGDNGQEVKPKNLKITLDKKQDNDVEKSVHAIGDTITYTVDTIIPDFGKKLNADDELVTVTSLLSDDIKSLIKVKLNDTMTDGLTYGKDLTITANTDTTDTADDYTFTANDFETFNETDRGFEVVFKWDALENYQGSSITLNYTAVLNENAVVDTGSNKNTIEYEYTNNLLVDYLNPGDPGYPENPATPGAPVPVLPSETTDDSTEVYTYAMTLTKTFENMSASAANVDASAVEFKVYDKDAKAFLKFKAVDGGYVVDPAGSETMNLTKEGTLYVKGFKVGNYELHETNTVEDYSKLTTSVDLVLEQKDAVDAASGVKATHYVKKTANTLTNTGRDTFTISINNVKKQFDLPQTGGLGILIFTIAGGVLMAGAIIIFATLRKKKEVE